MFHEVVFFYPFHLTFDNFCCVFARFVIMLRYDARMSRYGITGSFTGVRRGRREVSPVGREVLRFTSGLGVDGHRFCTGVNISHNALRSGANVARSMLTGFVTAFPSISVR